MKQHIYADNAATTQLDGDAFEAMKPWLLESFGNPSQPYSFSRLPRRALESAREDIATCIGAQADEIFFTSGGTESDNWVIKGSASAFQGGETILASAFEHHAVLNACKAVERFGIPVIYLSPSTDGYIEPEMLDRIVSSNSPQLVSVMYANNELGTIQPIRHLCEISHIHGGLFHTDAVQAVGHIPLNVHELGVDFLSASAHKFNGPRGIGFLYIRHGLSLSPYMSGGLQEFGRRAGTENVANIVGMAVALQKNCESMETTRLHLLSLESQLIDRLNVAGIFYQRNGGSEILPGLLSLSFPGSDGEAILHRMDLMGISISTGSACNGSNTEISHVLGAIKLDKELARGTVRISLGKNNTEEDVKGIGDALIKILKF